MTTTEAKRGWFSFWGKSTPSGFGASSTAEQVTEGIDASQLTVIVTGATSGIGEETARVLALRGAQVVIAVRNVVAGEKVKSAILKETGNARVHVLELDLGSLNSVQKFADGFNALNIPLNILINNAGIMGCPFTLTAEGIEAQFGTNHIGHFLLTELLLNKLKVTAQESGIEGRIVNVASNAHMLSYSGGIRFETLNDKSSYSPYLAYGQSKLANILHASELAKRLQEEGANVTANSLHPGPIRTNLTRSFRFIGVVTFLTAMFFKSIPQGAATQCYVALHPSLKGVTGKYFSDCNEDKPSAFAKDPELAKKLWEYSEKVVLGQQK